MLVNASRRLLRSAAAPSAKVRSFGVGGSIDDSIVRGDASPPPCIPRRPKRRWLLWGAGPSPRSDDRATGWRVEAVTLASGLTDLTRALVRPSFFHTHTKRTQGLAARGMSTSVRFCGSQ